MGIVSVIVGAFAATFGGTLVGAGTSLIFGLNAFGSFLARTAIGLALNALTPKPKGARQTPARQGYTVNQRGSALDHQIIYGRMRVGGVVVFDGTTGDSNKYLHRVIAVAGHEVESFDGFWINDALVTGIEADGNVTEVTLPDGETSDRYDGLLRIRTRLGKDTQTADPRLVEEVTNWTEDHKLSGIAYIYVRFGFDQDKFPNGVPEVTATIKGKKVFDPRDDTTAWSDNPALCIRDYLTSGYGLSEDSSNVDDDLIETAADVCDETDTDAGTTRYTCNGAFTTEATPYDVLGDMLTSMGGLLWYAQGKWRMKPAYWVAPTMTFNEDDLRSSIAVSTRHSRRDNYNIVRGTFRGEESDWQVTDYPEVSKTSFINADGGQESVADIELPFTDNSIEARRIARIALERNRQQLTVSASFGLRAFKVQVGDVINLTIDRFGWNNKSFEVTSWTFGLVDGLDLQVQMTLREISANVFDEVADGIVFEKDNTNLLSPFDVPSVGVNVTAGLRVYNQKVTNVADVVVSSSQSNRIDFVEVQYKPVAESTWVSVGRGDLGNFTVVDISTGRYDFRARAVNTFGVKGEWEFSLDQDINPFAGPPEDVTGFDYEISGNTVFFVWDANSDADLSHYTIRINPETTGATWSNSSVALAKVARPSTTASLPARSGTFLIKAVDKEGNESVNTSSVVIQLSELRPLGVSELVTEDPDFNSVVSNIAVVSNTIEIDDVSGSSPEGEYTFPLTLPGTGDPFLDIGSTVNARVTGQYVFTRKYKGGGSLLWDDIAGDWDSWPDNWDGWTDEDANFADQTVKIFVSSTEDDPTGTPTWSDYKLANGNFIVGRAFRFRADLSSSSTNYTPSVSELSVTVEY